MKKSLSVMVFVLAALFAPPAMAHAHLEKAIPAAGAMPMAPVDHVDLYYSEALEPAFSLASLSDAGGSPVKARSALDPADSRHLVLTPATPLKNGTFKVKWQAVSVDTHKTQGDFQFKVMP